MLPKPHGQAQHSAVGHTQRMDYLGGNASEDAGQHSMLDGCRCSAWKSRIASDIPHHAFCGDTSSNDFKVLSHDVAGHVELW